jgi:predicted phosphodiesterase
VRLFAVGPDQIQLDWPGRPGRWVGAGLLPHSRPRRVTVGDRVWDLAAAGEGPPAGAALPGGAITADGLPSGARVRVTVEGRGGTRTLSATTPALPGRPLARVATLTDLHIGEPVFGMRKTIVDTARSGDPAPQRCARAALAEATAWGADLVVVKGDVTHRGWRDQWTAAVATLRCAGPPLVVTTGNHDLASSREADPARVLAGSGLAHADPLLVVDLDGLRVVTATTACDGRSAGSLGAASAAVIDAVASSDRPVLLCMHHPPERAPVPTGPSTGIRWPEAPRLFAALGRTGRQVVISTGHTHRHRIWSRRGVAVAETGGTRDYPGTWTQYLACEGGLVQVTRRIEDPEVLAWTDRTARAAGGLWGRYAEGRLEDRCRVWRWR